MSYSSSEVETCLGVIKQFLHCPICLDDVRNPVVTPCAHTYCKFCIDQHIGNKRSVNCPLCNKKLTLRSLKFSSKVTNIIEICRKVIEVYESETKTTLYRKDLSSNLHLSQELTQVQPAVTQLNKLNDFEETNTKISVFGSENNSLSVSKDPKFKSQPRPRILLGTAARTRHTKRICVKKAPDLEVYDDGILQTQPMNNCMLATKFEKPLSPNIQVVERIENSNVFTELFALTQATQPMVDISDSESLFVSVDRINRAQMKCDLSNGYNEHLKKTDMFGPVKLQPSQRNVRKNLITSLPPLPPTFNRGTEVPVLIDKEIAPKECHSSSLKRSNNTLSNRPRKQSRRESNTTLLSSRGLITKTHEVLCHVQPSSNTLISLEPKRPSIGASTTSRACSLRSDCETVTNLRSKKKSYSFTGPTTVFRTPSFLARQRLLRKYRTNRIVISEKDRVVRGASFKSPGWSRWRQMCHEFRRRSSSFRLAFRRLSGLEKVGCKKSSSTKDCSTSEVTCVKEVPRRSASASSRVGLSLSRWGTAGSRRSKKKTVSLQKSKKIIVSETQTDVSGLSNIHFSTGIILDTPLSPESLNCVHVEKNTSENLQKENCRFVLPLHRLLSRDNFHSRSISARIRPMFNQSGVLRNDSFTSISPTIQNFPKNLGIVNRSSEFSAKQSDDKLPVSPNIDVYFHPLRCSACGEALLLQTDDGIPTTPSQCGLNLILQPTNPDPSCSISSSYWQAEDPGDTIFTEMHLDAIVKANLPYVEELNDTNIIPSTSNDLTKNLQSTTKGHCDTCKDNAKTPKNHVFDTFSNVEVVSTAESLVQKELSNSNKDEESSSIFLMTKKSFEESGIPIGHDIEVSTNDQVISLEERTNQSTFQGSCSEIMPTVDRDRLRHECEELEAVVAALQQQLEAQADELNPQDAEDLLKSAGTEPMNEDIIDPSSTSSLEQQNEAVHVNEEITNGENQRFIEPINNKFLKHVETPIQVIPETCPSENLELIPSSQTEEESELNASDPIHTTNYSLSTSLHDLKSFNQTITESHRVEASQPAHMQSQHSLCDFIPGSMIALTQNQSVPAGAESSLSNCPETNPSPSKTLSDYKGSDSSSITTEPSKNKPILAITGSNLTPTDAGLLHKFCMRFGFLEHNRFIPRQTTHVVIKEEPGRPKVVKRTLKYFMAILNRAWIVNTDWIRQCLTSNILLDEAPFEIEGDTVCGDCHEGPRRGRFGVPALTQLPEKIQFGSHASRLDDVQSSDRRPFADLWLCAYGSLGALSATDFIQLALDGGASRVFENPRDLVAATDKYVQGLPVNSKPKAIILTDREPPTFSLSKCQELYRTYGIPIISVDWMLNCISFYRRLPISQVYRICPVPNPISVKIPKHN